MSAEDDTERRSYALEKIRRDLRKYLDSCFKKSEQPLRQSAFEISYESKILLSPSEEKAMTRQIDASHGDLFGIRMSYTSKRRRRHPSVTNITVKASRRRIPRR